MMNRRWQQAAGFRDQNCPLLNNSLKKKKTLINIHLMLLMNFSLNFAMHWRPAVEWRMEDVCFVLSTAEFHVKCK